MKKIYLFILFGTFSLALINAQTPANRTSNTIIADVLAQMPTQKTNQYNNLIKELVSTGEEGIITLIKMMSPPGQGSNAQIEYALSGISNFVSAEGQEENRIIISTAYTKALDTVNDAEIKAFIIRQLEIAGGEESIVKLASYLTDEKLSEPACRALVSIKTPSATTALTDGLSSTTNNKCRKNIIQAVGEMEIQQAESTLQKILAENNPELQQTVLFALSRCGTHLSLPLLAEKAQNAKLTLDYTGANEAYIRLIKRVLALGDAKNAEKAADNLMKQAVKYNSMQSRIAAQEIRININPATTLKEVEKALKDKEREFRYATLNIASPYAGNMLYTTLLKNLKKYNNNIATDIINWMQEECENPTKRQVIENLATDILIEETSNKDIQVKESSIKLLAKIGNHKSIVALAALLASGDAQTIALAKEALTTVSGDIASAIVSNINNMDENGQKAAIELLAKRKADKHFTVIQNLLSSESKTVKDAAFVALKDVAVANNLSALYALLENNKEYAADVQKAIISALYSYSPETKTENVITQMQSSKSNKELYFTILASTGTDKALDIIWQSFLNSSGSARDEAFKALLSMQHADITKKLYAISTNNAYSQYAEQAINKYIQLASDNRLTGENRRLLLTNAIEIAQNNNQINTILSQLGRTNSYLAMVLASKYLDNKATAQNAAVAVMNIGLSNKNFTGKTVEDLLEKVIAILDNPDAEYQRQAIKKHLNEIPKEESFVSIFNGKDLTGWKGLVENPIARAKMKLNDLAKKQEVADEIARKHWYAENDVLIFDGTGGDNLCTTKQYGDFEMLVDWKLDINGTEPDAGIYLRGTPQVQIWDISRVNVGAQVGSGGLYNNQKNPSNPLKVADNMLGEWNTFYIKMVGDRVTVWLNGEIVVNNVIMENFWDRSQPIPAIEQLELQAHGSKVYYRNIYVKELESTQPFELSEQEKKEDYKVLFDGTNMHQWTGNTVDYILEEGTISMHPSSSHGGNLYTIEEFGDFIIRFEFELTPAANNGLGIRTPMEGDAAYVGMELQILDNEAPIYSKLAEYQYHGSVYGIIPAKRGYLKPTGEWNYQEVIAKGDNIKVILNGTVILDGNIREATKNGTPDKKEHPGLFNKKGHIAFLGHGSPVKFKNIRIKELK